MPDAIMLEFRKQFFGTLLVEMLDTAPAVGGDNLELLCMNLEKPRYERAFATFQVPKHTNFVGKALPSLRATEGLVNAPIVADAHLCPEGILDLVHARQT